jgi:hypothetical protein
MLKHLRDISLHVLCAVLMMAACFPSSTPLWIAFPWALCIGVFWFGREWGQSDKPIAEWSNWKIAEAAAPAATALLCAGGITQWRVS